MYDALLFLAYDLFLVLSYMLNIRTWAFDQFFQLFDLGIGGIVYVLVNIVAHRLLTTPWANSWGVFYKYVIE